MKNKNLHVDIPKQTNADVVRQHSLKTPVFTRTRIMVLALALVVALSISGTLAYLAWTSNQTPNRAVSGDVEIEIIEVNKKDGTSTTVNTANNESTGTASGGPDTKNVTVKSDADVNRVKEVARVQFVPELASLQDSSANEVIGEYWGEGVKGDQTSGYYVETEVLKLWLVDDYADNWIYDNGAFYYNKVLDKDTQTPQLLKGVTLQDSASKSDYSSIKVRVVADAIQATPAEALADWGFQADTSGNVTKKSTS